MALGPSRISLVGETPYAHEREAIEFAIGALPNNDPFYLWALAEVLDPASGRLDEIDLIIIGYSAIYLVEVKSGPGRYEGDQLDWRRLVSGEPPRRMDAPYPLANSKAKRLRSLLDRKLHGQAPFVQALVFLSAADLELQLSPEGRVGVVTRETLARAITHHEFPGRNPASSGRGGRIDAPLMKEIARAMTAIGVRPRAGKAFVGEYELGAVLQDGPGYQDREAAHRSSPRLRRRARIYLVPRATSIERRQQLWRAADREVAMLHDLREHRSILKITDYVREAPLGPTVLFDDFEGGQRLDAFLRSHPDLSFAHQIAILEQVSSALEYCHRRSILHGAVSPEAVLVCQAAPDATPPLEVRLCNFQLGSSQTVEATQHRSALSSEPAALYQAPELRLDPLAAGRHSDVFSLGALAYFVFTRQPPASSVAEVEERLRRDRGLDPRAASAGIPEDVARVVLFATHPSFAERCDDVAAWRELLLESATRPEKSDEAEPDPLTVGKKALLPPDLEVVEVLGHGASARVLKVRRQSDDRELALKVSLDPEHDERLHAEALALARLRHPRIVQLLAERSIGGRPCLLLSLAGERTLQQELTREGSVGLDFASRYGDDLLQALEYLEEEGVPHRDVKPANLGVGGRSKTANHLTLFDFSLVDAPRTEVRAGTAAYRDPFLPERGAWDTAADRWSAALTLHEMLTGVRPSLDRSPLDPEARIELAAERFDPTVRDRLAAFFNRAFQHTAADRFHDTASMRRAWLACFDAPHVTTVAERPPRADAADASEDTPETADPPQEIDLQGVQPETPIAALPLSPRARNALDRAGLTTADDLLRLPESRLPAMRGVGARVAKEILRVRDAWQRRRTEPAAAPVAFYPGYRGEDHYVWAADLAAACVAALRDAGLRTLSALAAAPREQILAMAARQGFDAAPLHRRLDEEQRRANERDHPTTLEGWIEALLAAGKRNHAARLLYGLEPPLLLRSDVAVRDVAAALGITSAAVYIALGKCRRAWRKHAAFAELVERCRLLVDGAGGAVPLTRAADLVRADLPHDRTADEALTLARAAALVRLVAETLREEEAEGLTILRLREHELWVCASEVHGEVLKRLGAEADRLAALTVLASSAEALRALGEIAAGSPLAALPPDRLADLAAAASASAARSTSLEIYPRGMDAGRALELTAAVLAGQLTPEDLQQRVRARYPEASPLPPPPALDTLAARIGLVWNPEARVYQRPGEAVGPTTLSTTVSGLSYQPTALPHEPRATTPEALHARDVDERLRSAVARRQLRVLGVPADRALEATLRLERALGLEARPLDRLLLGEIERLAEEMKVDPRRIHEADREGPAGRGWPRLCQLAALAAESLARKLLPPTAPLLLIQPGLLARYRLTAFLDRLVEASRRDEAAAILLVVPSYDTAGMPLINGTLPISGLLPSQRLWVPLEWIGNVHNAAAAP